MGLKNFVSQRGYQLLKSAVLKLRLSVTIKHGQKECFVFLLHHNEQTRVYKLVWAQLDVGFGEFLVIRVNIYTYISL